MFDATESLVAAVAEKTRPEQSFHRWYNIDMTIVWVIQKINMQRFTIIETF